MLEFNLSWAYYYAVMLMSGVILLASLISIALTDIVHINVKINTKIVGDRLECVRCRHAKIDDLSKRADRAVTIEERHQVFDEMKKYRDTYVLNRRV